MAVRVRKLARELDRSPEDVLLLLADLGHDRYRSEDDMLSDGVVDQVRKAARTRPPRARIAATSAPRVPPTPSVEPSRRAASDPGGGGGGGVAAGDLMAMLVPGVVRVGERRTRRTDPAGTRPTVAPPREPPARPARPAEIGSEAPAPVSEAASALEAARGELARLEEARRDDQVTLAALGAELRSAEERVAALSDGLVQANARIAELEARAVEPQGTTLLSLLEERGLRGLDEAERAIAALSGSHQLGRLLGTLVAADPAAVRRVLGERLVLFGGPVPEGLSFPGLTVSTDRADVPGPEQLQRTLARLGELSLLNGYRRVLVVGVAPRWHTMLRESIDRRVELVFRASVGEESGRFDLIVVWAGQDSATTEADRSPAPKPAEPRPRRIDVRAGSLGDFLERWVTALAG